MEDYVLKTLESKTHINKQSNTDVNKLLVLEQAQKIGLDVPEYFLAENQISQPCDKHRGLSAARNSQKQYRPLCGPYCPFLLFIQLYGKLLLPPFVVPVFL